MVANQPADVPVKDTVSRETIKHRRERLTLFVHPNTIIRLKTLSELYREKNGRIIDHLVYTLWYARACKVNHCVNGKQCSFGQPMSESDIL